jgi:HAD superfamily hydrolase (TIGR01509 family)
MSIKGLIFDFDGLIVDTEGPIFQSWQELYQSYGFVLPQDKWAKTIGTAEPDYNPVRELDRLAGGPLDWATIEPARRERELGLIDGQPPRPGVPEILQAAKNRGLKVGLASSSTCAWVTGHLTRLNLIHYFDCILASDDVQRTKPNPELFLSALDCLELDADQAIVFEDSLNGILAAKRAGIFAVAVPIPLTRNLPLELADLCLDSLAELSLDEILSKAGG